jgi:uncharacterized protein DUF3276
VEGNKDNERKEIFSERVRAGKRTYFFDVKATRSNDYYLTITESKRRYKDDGYTYEKHKIFLYKEDFNKFLKGLNAVVNHVKEELLPEVDFDKFDRDREEHFNARENGSSAGLAHDATTTETETEDTTEVDEVNANAEQTTEPEDTTKVENELKWD